MKKSAFLVALYLFFVGLTVYYPTEVDAANGADFKAGRIIDDQIFTDKNAATAGEIDAIIRSKVTGGVCDTNGVQSSGKLNPTTGKIYTNAEWGAINETPIPFVCLYEYRENPTTKESNFGNPSKVIAGSKTAGQIIWDAAQAHVISPKALLITLQKEQGLVTARAPIKKQYDRAMGAACPDTSPCDPTKAGFSTQVNYAAQRFRKYIDAPFLYFAGKINNIYWNVVSTGCGTGPVFIETKSTAALYHFTPYQPNKAALDDLYGSGNACSSYGNRNFWRYYNDWFGSTLVPETPDKPIVKFSDDSEVIGDLKTTTNLKNSFTVTNYNAALQYKVYNGESLLGDYKGTPFELNLPNMDYVIFVKASNQGQLNEKPFYYRVRSPNVNAKECADIVDMVLVVNFWGQTNPATDLNLDGKTDITDMVIVNNSWMKACVQ